MVRDQEPANLPGDFNGDDEGGLFGGRPPIPLIGGLLVAVIVGAVIVVVALGSGGSDNGSDLPGSPLAQATVSPTQGASAGLATGEPPTPQATLDLSQPTITAAPNLDSVDAEDRLVIPRFSINARLTFRSVGLDGIMANPDGPDDVAYYNFASWPGKGGAPGRGGNAVFAGHVDSGSEACADGTIPPPCEAVFWDISDLLLGDEIQVLVDGVSYTYSVTSNESVVAATAPWDQIVSATDQETITLITCGGDFNRVTREYTNRQVVVAVRIS